MSGMSANKKHWVQVYAEKTQSTGNGLGQMLLVSIWHDSFGRRYARPEIEILLKQSRIRIRRLVASLALGTLERLHRVAPYRHLDK